MTIYLMHCFYVCNLLNHFMRWFCILPISLHSLPCLEALADHLTWLHRGIRKWCVPGPLTIVKYLVKSLRVTCRHIWRFCSLETLHHFYHYSQFYAMSTLGILFLKVYTAFSLSRNVNTVIGYLSVFLI